MTEVEKVIAAALLGETLGDRTGVDVVRVARLAARALERANLVVNGSHTFQPGAAPGETISHQHPLHIDGCREPQLGGGSVGS